jgi:hypothetical protein
LNVSLKIIVRNSVFTAKSQKTEEDDNEKKRGTRRDCGAGDPLTQEVQVPDLV